MVKKVKNYKYIYKKVKFPNILRYREITLSGLGNILQLSFTLAGMVIGVEEVIAVEGGVVFLR